MHHILVVEDDPAVLRVVVRALEVEGYAVASARNGAEALTEVESDRPLLILLDMHMPVMDGWRFKQALGQRGLDVPIVVMTAAVNAASYADDIQANGYLGKPFDIDELLSVVERLRAAC